MEEVAEEDQEGADEELDSERFQERLEREYAEDQIGDAEGDVELDENGLVSQEALDAAVTEFIESQKLRDRKLYREYSDQPPELVPVLRKALPAELQEDPAKLAQDKAEVISKQ